MNEKEKKIFRTLMARYKHNWDKNQYNRTNYDEDLESYLSFRNRDSYPLAYNHTFPRLIPIIYTILSRFMDQLYQSGNIVSVKPRKKVDLNRAKGIEGTLNFQLESLNDVDMQGGSYLTMIKWFFNALTFGKGIAKAYWKKEERIAPRRIALPRPNFDRMGNFQGMDIIDYVNQEMQTIYDGPYVEILHNKLFLPDPEYKSIQKMPAVFLIYKRNVDELKKMKDKGIYKNIKDLGWHSAGGASQRPQDSDEAFVKGLEIEGGLTIDQIEDEHRAPEVDVLECYTKLILDSAPYEVGSGVKIKGMEEEVIVHIGNYKTILSLQRNTYGVRPLFDIGCYMHPEIYWDLGLIRLTKGIQDQINTLANLRIQNVMMMVNQMLRVDPDSDIDPAALVWKPFGIVPAHQGEVEPLTIPDMHSNLFLEQENFYENAIQDITGMYCLLTEGKDTDYEILTNKGWKKFGDLDRTEDVMTLDYDSELMEWQKPSDYLEYPEKEYDCYHFKNQSAEFICSPNHRIPLFSKHRMQFKGKKKLMEIQDIPEGYYGNYSIPVAGFNWKGNDLWEVPFDDISQEDWCAFMGIWVAEGHTSNPRQGDYVIGISQRSDKNKVNKIDKLLKQLPFNFQYRQGQWIVYNKELYIYLKQFGKAHNKYVPRYILNSSVKLLGIFLNWYLMGDGSFVRNEDRFTTVSERLADDIQEISLKIGKKATIREDNNSKLGENCHNRWVGEITDNHRYTGLQGHGVEHQVIQKKKYKGRMTCLSVPNGIFLIRKEKKHIWTGNSYNMGQTPQRQERVGVVHSIQSMGEARAKLMLMSNDYLGIRPLLKYMMILNTFHLPSGFEYRVTEKEGQSFGQLFGDDIHPDFDFAARYTAMEPALGKHFRAQNLIQMSQQWVNNPWINQYQYIKTMMELMDIREADLLLKSPQQFQQEMAQQQKAAMQMEEAERRGKQQLEQVKAGGKLRLSDKDFQEDQELAGQQFGYDMALEAIKNEMSPEV